MFAFPTKIFISPSYLFASIFLPFFLPRIQCIPWLKVFSPCGCGVGRAGFIGHGPEIFILLPPSGSL